MRSKAILLLFLLAPLAMLSQNTIKDTVYGNVKSVREKLIFLDSIRQNYKLFAEEDEYGHHGFTSRRATISRFNTFWYTLPFVHYMNYYREYDDKNRITSETWYNKDNSFLTKYEFAYDRKGNLTEEKEIEENGITETTRRFGYDYHGKLKSKLVINKDSDYGYHFRSYEYDNECKLIFEESHSEEGKENELNYEYENGKCIRTYIKTPYLWITTETHKGKRQIREWNTVLRFEYEYDSVGNKIATKDYISRLEGGNVSPQVTRYTYDKHNNMTAIIYYYPERQNSWQYTYDDKDRTSSEKLTVNGKTTINSQFYYNGKNLIKLLYTENGKTTTVTFSYKFDSHNNWTEQTKSINGKPLYVRKREIVYY